MSGIIVSSGGVKYGAANGLVLNNNIPLQWRNASGSLTSVLVLDSSNNVLIQTGTSDGADTSRLSLVAAGARGISRGAGIDLYGNEDPGSNDGNIYIIPGDVGGSLIDLRISNASGSVGVRRTSGNLSWQFNAAGDLTSVAAEGGDLIFARAGKTISMQMDGSNPAYGLATPNGTTTVTVNTTAMVSGARVFFTRSGSVTNKGVIVLTGSVAGTSFSFKSTDALDTEANSVTWWIIKESA